MSKVSIAYCRAVTPSGAGYACFAFKQTPLGWEVSTSFCSPKDKFVKAISRKIASGRLEAGRPNSTVSVTAEELGGKLVVHRLLSVSASRLGEQVPSWFRKAWRQGRVFCSLSEKTEHLLEP